MRKNSIIGPLVLFTIAALSSGAARAEYVSSSGSACRSNTNVTCIDYSDYFRNAGTNIVTAVCPLNLGQIGIAWNGVTQIIVRYADYSTNSTFSCILARTNYAGQRTESAMRYTCATAGGCDTLNQSYTGIGNYLAIDVPGSLIAVDDSVTLECTVPPMNSSSQKSGIISYYLQ
jgi:hypothetical protein